MCVLLVCRAGRCVEEGPPFDTDGDRVAPPPCGDDCDDRNASTFPGAAETCNGIDDDCDGVVDEGAPGARAFLPMLRSMSRTGLLSSLRRLFGAASSAARRASDGDGRQPMRSTSAAARVGPALRTARSQSSSTSSRPCASERCISACVSSASRSSSSARWRSLSVVAMAGSPTKAVPGSAGATSIHAWKTRCACSLSAAKALRASWKRA
ncbi:MAG TPA: hypothetical protein DEF51_28615 [Myxococcales bacterium]|nr:hypothetical protein [Myxococcales bacterium]